jgi:hypothetical protein
MPEIDYIKEAKEFLEIMHREEWMTNEDWEEFLSVYDKLDVFTAEIPSIEETANALRLGVEKGYSVETQKELARILKLRYIKIK